MSREVEFIGRDFEINEIKNAFSEWMTSRNIFIEGDGGIGKTRLLQESREHARQHKIAEMEEQCTIALVQEFTNSEWSKEFTKGINDTAHEFGVKVIFTDANFDIAKMAKDLDMVIEKNPDVIVVSLGTSKVIQPSILRAIKQGIKVVTFDNSLQGIPGLKSRIEQDDIDGARLLSKDLSDHINYHGEVAVVWAKGHVEQERRREVSLSYFSKYPDIKLIDTQVLMSPNAENNAYDIVENLLTTHPNIKAIWVSFNEFARGITRALIKKGKSDIGVFSFDLCPSDYKLMKLPDSPWVSTVAISPQEGGRIVMRLSVTVANNRDVKRHYQLPMVLVKKNDIVLEKKTLADWYKQDIGWSNWLHSLHASSQAKQKSHLFVTDIFDFDDNILLVSENLELHLLQTLVDNRSESYNRILRELRELREIEIGGGINSLAVQKEKIIKSLVDAINSTSEERRVVLFFDTVEKVDQSTCDRLVAITTQLKNAVCVYSGRKYPGLFWKSLSRKSKKLAQKIPLLSLSKEESQYYILNKQKKARVFLPDELVKKLVLLSNGHPILIDLAVEFVARAISLESVNKIDIGNFSRLTKPKQKNVRDNFEEKLVQNILQIRRPIDKLILMLSWVYPLNENMISHMMNLPINESANLYREASGYVFVKILPGGLGISLHDEMRELFKKYIWQKIDRNKERRRRDSQLAADMYINIDDNLRLKKKMLENSLRVRKHSIVNAFEIEKIKRERELATERWLEHFFYADLDKAFQEWKKLINKVRLGKKYSFVHRLANLAKTYEKDFDTKQKQDFNFYYGRSLADIGKQSEALPILFDLLKRSDANKAGILNTLGVIYRKKGEYLIAKKYQLECLELIDEKNLQARSNILNQIGVISRHLGEYSEAKDRYSLAQKLAVELHSQLKQDDQKVANQSLLASLSNNLAYVFGLQRDFRTAETLCNDALRMWSTAEKFAAAARAETTLAILLRDQGFHTRAFNLLVSAIDRLTEPEYSEELCRAYFHLGWTEWYLAEEHTGEETDIGDITWNVDRLEAALEKFKKSKQIADKYELKAELPGIYHQTASVLWHLSRSLGDRKLQAEARHLNKEALVVSEEINDLRYAIDTILGDAEWDYELGKFDRIKKYSAILKKKYGLYIIRYKLYFGRMGRIEADVALKQQNFNLAFKKYTEAFLLINMHEGFGRYSIERELTRLGRKIEQIEPEIANKWIDFLKTEWADKPKTELLVSWCDQQLLHNRIRLIG